MLNRLVLETMPYKARARGGRIRKRWHLFERLVILFPLFLKVIGGYERGKANAERIITNRYSVAFNNLPDFLDGYRILHLSDLHIDHVPDQADRIAMATGPLSFNICIITGDFRHATRGGFNKAMQLLEYLVEELNPEEGVYATLGNHDTCLMAEPLEKMGVVLLANETIKTPGGLTLTGIDDPHYYYTDYALRALEMTGNGFKVVMVHTPELFREAAQNRYSLYLCGHTHGGQIALPFGIPVVTHLNAGRRFYRGWWSYGRMKGYTNQGCGTVGIPVRFNTESEVALIELKKRRPSYDADKAPGSAS